MIHRWWCGLIAGALAGCASFASAQVEGIPAGFTRIFNGRNADGWHWSRTVHHGTTAVAKVSDGVLTLESYPYGQAERPLTGKTDRP